MSRRVVFEDYYEHNNTTVAQKNVLDHLSPIVYSYIVPVAIYTVVQPIWVKTDGSLTEFVKNMTLWRSHRCRMFERKNSNTPDLVDNYNVH